jgi:sigma-54 dependent transcriptional regulator, acetoin dehydrogenase operon transcriptional activator AcoR
MRFLPPMPESSPADVRLAWRDYMQAGVISGTVRDHVARAWQRSRAAGCDPYRAKADLLEPAGIIALLKQQNRLVQIATPFLIALSRAAGADRHAAMLGDGDGRVLKTIGDAETMADESFPRAGSLLSESMAGANGIGTALAERSYVELVGPEHYIEGFHAFTCQGVPLASTGASPAGVLSMSVRREETATKVRDILFCASEAAECELLSASLSATLAAAGELVVTLESLRQDIVQRIAMARLQLEFAARQIASGADASTTLHAAQQLVGKFQRQAAVWRNLVGEATGAPEPIVLSDLVQDFMALLETEARVAFVRLVWGRAEKKMVLEDARQLSQRLLTAFLDAMQAAARESDITVHVSAENAHAKVALHGLSPSAKPLSYTVVAPLMV